LIAGRKVGNVRKQYVCPVCGGTDLRSDALAKWDVKNQEWEMVSVLDTTTCETCRGEEITPIEVKLGESE
jgi:RNA polymerase subunit RPABC4/transcription elongation factor Spt4